MPGELMSAVTAKADISQSWVRQLAAASPGPLSQQSLGSLRTRWPKSVQAIPCSGSGMSALGQRQTFALHQRMSALPPDSRHSASQVERLLMTLALGVWAFGGHIDNLDFGCF